MKDSSRKWAIELVEGILGHRVLFLVVFLAFAQALLLISTALDKSDTADEELYIGAAALQWAHRDFTFNCMAPALPKWGFAVALRLVDPSITRVPRESRAAISHMLWSRPVSELRRNLVAGRFATIFVTVVCGLFLWLAARRFGERAALVTYTMWCFSPSILAHGSLATMDGWVTGLCCVAIWSAVRFLERPTAWRSAQMGIVMSGIAASKVTGLGLIPVVAAVCIWALVRRSRAEGTPLRGSLILCAVSFSLAFFLVLWGIYGFSVGEIVEAERLRRRGFGWWEWVLVPVPFPMWIRGLLFQIDHGLRGHETYLFGQVGYTGWWWFYLAAIALKTTIGAQILALLALLAWARKPGGRRRECLSNAAIMAYPVILVATMSLGKAQYGIKYILPTFPFVMLWIGRMIGVLQRLSARKVQAIGATALMLGILESVSVHPHYLMFFNIWAGGPTGGPRYLICGDDWGQDQRRLAEWQKKRGISRIYYTPFSGNPSSWGIVYDTIPCKPTTGVFALHAIHVHCPKGVPPGCLDWLTVEPPDERIGYSIYIYHVDEERLARLIKKRRTAKPFWRSGSPP